MLVWDIECYVNYFLVKFYDREANRFYGFTKTEFQQLDVASIRMILRTQTIVGFNTKRYDVPMLACALAGFDNAALKKVSDFIIVENAQPWDVERQFGVAIPEMDSIDLFDVAPGMASLKIYGGRLHAERMQDLPIEPSAVLTPDEMTTIDNYCGNDLLTTLNLYDSLKADIDLRIDLGKQYGIDLRSKSDAQIAEAAFKKLLPFKVYPPQIPPGSSFQYRPPSFIQFQTPVMRDALALISRSNFVIEKSGSPSMPAELDKFTITLGGGVYRLGIGGLHSSEERASHRADSAHSLVDVDVVSYYPKIISILRMYPKQIGPVFLDIYDGWIDTRIKYKNAGEKKKAGTFKIKINGSFGKLGSKYSILYDPSMMIQTTVTGQLSLLMLIEMLHVAGIGVVSANTDGVVIKCPRALEPVRDAIVKRWEFLTGFETEANEYSALFSRDVNNYLAFKPNGEVKSKGAYADPGLAKNPTNIICVDAVKAYILDGTPLATTIRGCSDIRKFITVRAVKGGGEWVHDTMSATTIAGRSADLTARGWFKLLDVWFKRDDNAPLKLAQAYDCARAAIPRTYLGKAVRWYYGAGQTGHIAYANNGNLVARSEGAKPCMGLPAVLPPDIDYGWYEREARSLLEDLNCY